MPFTLSCPGCEAKLKATEALVGKTIKCPRCSAPVRIQQPSPTAVATMPRLELPPARIEKAEEDYADFRDEAPAERMDELDELPEADDEDIEEAVAAEDDSDDGSRRRFKKGKKRRSGGVTQDEKTMAMFIYLLGIFTHFIGPLVLWLMKKDESKFIDYHGKQMINFSITLAIAALCLGFVGVPIVFITFGIGALIVGPLFMALNIYALVMIIIGAMKANKGEYYEFPISIRLIK